MSTVVIIISFLLVLLVGLGNYASAFVVVPPSSWTTTSKSAISVAKGQGITSRWSSTSSSLLHAGGFEWEDPGEAFDQGVENPFKNPELLTKKSGSGGDDEGGDETQMKVDPARLLSPRLNGSNLYFIGMMGTGKSTIGNIIARRKFY